MMMRYASILPLLFLLFVTHASHAEGGCPPGQFPQRGQGWQTCVPIPGSSSMQTVAPPPRRTKYETRWQAISTDATVGALGTSLNLRTQAEAEEAATADCHAKGGKDCIIQISDGNGCAVLVVGESTMNTESDMDINKATQMAMSVCKKENKKCVVYYSACGTAAIVPE